MNEEKEKNEFPPIIEEEILVGKSKKAVGTPPPEEMLEPPVEKADRDTPPPPSSFGNRALQETFLSSLKAGAGQVWGSRILVLIVLLILCCIFVGANFILYFGSKEVMVEVEPEKIKMEVPKPPKVIILKRVEGTEQTETTELVEQKEKVVIKNKEPVKVPLNIGSTSIITILGHLMMVILVCRCLMLIFRKRNDLDSRLTQF